MTATQAAKELYKNLPKYESVVIYAGRSKIDVYEIGNQAGYYYVNPKEEKWALNADSVQKHYIFEKTEYGYMGRHKDKRIKGTWKILVK